MKERAPGRMKTKHMAIMNADRPKHVHSCPGDPDDSKKTAHAWSCSSAYCESMTRLCPDCGGNMPYFDE